MSSTVRVLRRAVSAHRGVFQIIAMRTLIVAPQRRQTKRKHKRRPAASGDAVHINHEARVLDDKLRELQKLAQSVKQDIAQRKEEKIQQMMDLEHDTEDADIDMLYNELMIEGSKSNDTLQISDGQSNTSVSLFDTPAKGINLPRPILDRLDDSVRNIVVKDRSNWNAVVSDLYTKKDGFKGLTAKDVGQFMSEIPAGSINVASVSMVDSMMKDASMDYTRHSYDFFMKHYAANGDAVKTQELFDLYSKVHEPSLYMYGHLIKAYVANSNLPRINVALEKMFDKGIEPSLQIYTNVLQLCVALDDSKQADEVFQMMKFRSVKSKPDVHAYNKMIHLACKDRDIHRAFDLYHEMLSEKLKPDIFTYDTLIRSCSKTNDHIVDGYNFISKVYETGLELGVNTFQSMLRLAARDGDLELARALYLLIFEKRGEPNAESLVYLMMAYRDFREGHVPQIFHHKDGSNMRRNVLRMVDFMGLHQTDVDDIQLQRRREMYPPLLPLSNVRAPKHIIAESNAIWAWNIAKNRTLLNSRTLIPYLRISVEHGDKDEFLRRWNQYTYACKEIGKDDVIIMEQQDDGSNAEPNDNLSPPALSFVKQMNYSIERNSELYLTYLSAGKRFEDYSMCERAWIERGKYRSTTVYQSLPRRTKAQLDFNFAREMVLALTHLKLLQDAVHVVKSSEKQFPWSFYTLKPLYVACEEVGDYASAREISAICGKDKARHRNLSLR